MHADLQGIHMTSMAALTENHSSKTSSKMGLAPTPACLQKSCKHSGMKSSINTLVTFSSSHTATARSGGHVISAQRVFHMFGKPMCTTGAKGQAVLSAQARPSVSTIHWLKRHHRLRCYGMPRKTIHCHQTK